MGRLVRRRGRIVKHRRVPRILASPDKRPGKLLGPADLEEAARALLKSASVEDKRIAFCGGFAAQKYGSGRLTADLDVVARDPPPAAFSGKRPLSFGGVRGKAGKVPIDWIVRDDRWSLLYEDALRCACPAAGLPLIRREHLVAMKMVAGRSKDELDVAAMLLRASAEAIERVAATVKKYLGAYAEDDLHAILAEARWRAGK
jgi:hypothetical protein